MSFDEEITKMEDVMESLLSEDRKDLDLAVALEVAERINQNKEERKLAVEILRVGLSKSTSQIVLKSVLLLETLVKNCNEKFHYEIASKPFMEALLKLLKRKRGKLGMFDKFFLDAKFLDMIEFKILYMIQLWADTFMMHEDEFPNIMFAYKTLRQEGIIFPPRDKNEKFMIHFKGKKSPIFDHLEEIYKKQTEDPKINQQQLYKADFVEPKIPDHDEEEKDSNEQDEGYKDLEKVNQRKKDKEMPANFDYETYNNFRLDKQELEILESSLNLLGDVIQNANTHEDLKSEIAVEIIDNLKQARERINMVINFGSFARSHDKELCQDLNKDIKYKFISYKEKYDYIKRNKKIENEKSKQQVSPTPRNINIQSELPNKNSVINENPAKPNKKLMKKLDPPKLSARGEPPKFSGRGEPPKDMNKTPNPSDFMDLLDLENPVIKNDNSDTSNPINKQTNLTNVKIDYAVEETKKEDNLGQNNNNAFNFDFNSVSKQRDTPKKEIDQIDILFG